MLCAAKSGKGGKKGEEDQEEKLETHWNKEGLLEINEAYNSDEDKPKVKPILKKKEVKKSSIEYIEPGMYTYKTA